MKQKLSIILQKIIKKKNKNLVKQRKLSKTKQKKLIRKIIKMNCQIIEFPKIF